MKPLRRHITHGFTLVEILVVVAIIVILATLSLAVFSRVRERGKAMICQSNLKQIALAVQQYTQDSGGQFPPYFSKLNVSPYGRYWYDLIQPYGGNQSVFHCPSSQLREQKTPNYGYNFLELNEIVRVAKNGTLVGSHESQLASASDVVLNQDSWDTYGDGVTIDGSPVQSSCGESTMGSLHSAGANFSFADGHVSWLSLSQQGEMRCEVEKRRKEKFGG